MLWEAKSKVYDLDPKLPWVDHKLTSCELLDRWSPQFFDQKVLRQDADKLGSDPYAGEAISSGYGGRVAVYEGIVYVYKYYRYVHTYIYIYVYVFFTLNILFMYLLMGVVPKRQGNLWPLRFCRQRLKTIVPRIFWLQAMPTSSLRQSCGSDRLMAIQNWLWTDTKLIFHIGSLTVVILEPLTWNPKSPCVTKKWCSEENGTAMSSWVLHSMACWLLMCCCWKSHTVHALYCWLLDTVFLQVRV